MTEVKEIFDFPVRRVPLYARTLGHNIKSDRDMILRTDTWEQLGIVSSGKKDFYHMVEHGTLVRQAREAIKELGFTDTKENTKLTKVGAKMFHEIDFPTEVIEPTPGDTVGMRLTMVNSYDGSTKVGFELGALRLICKNGLTAFRKAFFVLQKHNSLFNMEETVNQMGKAIQTFHLNVLGFYKLLGNTPLEVATGLAIIKDMIEKRNIPEKYGELTEAVWNEPHQANSILNEANDTVGISYVKHTELDKARNLWTFYNAFTLILTHVVKSFERRILMTNAVQNRVKGLL